MAPKKVEKPSSAAGYGADPASETSSEADPIDLEAMFAEMSLDDFREEVASSSGDTLKTLLPDIIQKQEELTMKMRIVKDSIREKDKELKKETSKQREAEKKELKKMEKALQRNAIINFTVTVDGLNVPMSCKGSTTFGEFRRLLVQRFNEMYPEHHLPKKLITKICIDHLGKNLREHARANIMNLGITEGCPACLHRRRCGRR